MTENGQICLAAVAMMKIGGLLTILILGGAIFGFVSTSLKGTGNAVGSALADNSWHGFPTRDCEPEDTGLKPVPPKKCRRVGVPPTEAAVLCPDDGGRVRPPYEIKIWLSKKSSES